MSAGDWPDTKTVTDSSRQKDGWSILHIPIRKVARAGTSIGSPDRRPARRPIRTGSISRWSSSADPDLAPAETVKVGGPVVIRITTTHARSGTTFCALRSGQTLLDRTHGDTGQLYM